MITVNGLIIFCKEDISLIENYNQAMSDTTQMWDCHHRDEIRVLPSGMVAIRSRQELIENGRYFDCPANELIFLTKFNHKSLHINNLSKETKIKLSNSHIGNKATYQKPRSEFGMKFYEHYGILITDNYNLYMKEFHWYKRHNKKCRWE